MSYSSVSPGDRESSERADLQRAFILAVIQPEKGGGRGRGAGMLSSMLPAIQTHRLMLIKHKFHISALFLRSRLCTHTNLCLQNSLTEILSEKAEDKCSAGHTNSFQGEKTDRRNESVLHLFVKAKGKVRCNNTYYLTSNCPPIPVVLLR